MKNFQYTSILKKDISRSFNRAADTYDEASFLQREVAERLDERLNYIQIQPKTILDLGAGTGYATRLLERRYKNAKIIGLDLAEQMLLKNKDHKKWFDRKRYICADAEKLPLGNHTIDLIFSSLLLHWVTNSEQAIREWQRVLKPDGLLLFSTLGPDTLYELRESWAEVDERAHVHPFLDMHHLGDYLLKAGYINPVVDMEFITVTFNDIKRIMLDLKNLGVQNIVKERQKGLMGKDKFTRFIHAYEKFRNAEGLIPVTYEVIYGLGWGRPNTQEQQEISIPLTAIQKTPPKF